MSNKIYTRVPVPKFPRNVFSLSRPVVGSLRMQRLYPTEIMEILPGDAINLRQETFLRTAPLVAPPLAKLTVSHHAFFVPAWQLSGKFDEFITGGEKMDFTDHLPYTYVGHIYQWIDGVLSMYNNILYDDTGGTWSDVVSFFRTTEPMDLILSIIEGCDFSRAVPFSMPEFQPLQAEDDNGNLVKYEDLTLDDFGGTAQGAIFNIAKANWDAWRDLNPIFMANAQLRVNLLPFFAQVKIWSEFFRDENLVDDPWEEVKDTYFDSVDLVNMAMDDYSALTGVLPANWTNDHTAALKLYSSIFGVRRRAWKKDRFTSALPWTQKGPDVYLPLAGTLPLSVDEGSSKLGTAQTVSIAATTGKITYGGNARSLVGSADLSDITGGTLMRDVRRAEAVLEFEEADGRFGNRYPENTLGQFGVYTPDSRLPRCQFLGSTKKVVSFGEVPQTSETGDTPLGTLAGKGTMYNPGFLFKHRFSMHGFVVIFTSIQVSAMYEQGIHPMFSRFDRTEYAWPRYARLGEEPIYTKELSIFGENLEEDSVFGYAPRYSTYKSDTGSIHGQMKSTLNYWTFSRKFPVDKDPVLNEEFIYNEPRRDAFAVTNPYAETFYFEIDWKVRSSRLLPFFGVPSI